MIFFMTFVILVNRIISLIENRCVILVPSTFDWWYASIFTVNFNWNHLRHRSIYPLIPASNHINYKAWDEIIYTFFTGHAIIHPCWDYHSPCSQCPGWWYVGVQGAMASAAMVHKCIDLDLQEHSGFSTGRVKLCTPLWKSDGTIFSTQIIHPLFFVVYPSFDTWHTWGGKYELC